MSFFAVIVVVKLLHKVFYFHFMIQGLIDFIVGDIQVKPEFDEIVFGIENEAYTGIEFAVKPSVGEMIKVQEFLRPGNLPIFEIQYHRYFDLQLYFTISKVLHHKDDNGHWIAVTLDATANIKEEILLLP
ncbi:MAG: hypothetical protein EOP56_15020 [Sphingobacteriales bacterium]|nr:MAG: hypothetical protein EOP56_15020 [Sphingobacteriales bacterium]